MRLERFPNRNGIGLPLGLDGVEEPTEGVQVTWRITFEREGADKPCCVAEWVVRYFETIPASR